MTEAISTEERYLIASNTSNLRVVSEVVGAGDILIASGWSASIGFGHTLLRLHSMPTRNMLEAVHLRVSEKAASVNASNPDAVASAVISWWLDRICKTCNGQKREVIENTPILSKIECPACHGYGEKKIPYGEIGRLLVNWMDASKTAHTARIKRFIHASL